MSVNAANGDDVPRRLDVTPRLSRTYERYVLGYPRAVLCVLFLVLAFFSYHSQDFQLDASADSLLLEDDADLKLFREVHERYPSNDRLFVTFTPEEDLFSDESMEGLKRLREELKAIPSVESIVTILDIPLLKSSDIPLTEMANNIQTLEEPTVDKSRAKEEILHSPVYRDLILSADGGTTALLLNLKENSHYKSLRKARNELRAKRRATGLSDTDRENLKRHSAAYDEAHAALNERRHQDIEKIRSIMRSYEEFGVLHLGGVSMIADDMMTFVRNDLVVFGLGVLVFLIVVLTLIFGEVRWIALPLLSCFYAGLLMIGMLGLIGWKVTIISSNFLALMLIITISMNIHLIVRYKQLCRDYPSNTQLDLVATTAKKMARPCFYTTLTTIMGFSSLAVSDIKPVIDFAWMMSAGLLVTFLTSFLLFPTILVLIGKSTSGTTRGREFLLTGHLAYITERHGKKVLALSILLAIASVVGISKLEVENSFINYFSEETEIFQGMKLIDEKLGGTTPLEVILNLEEQSEGEKPAEGAETVEQDKDLLELEASYALESADSAEYWFTPYKIDRIKEAHDYLDSLPEVGKVLSLASIVRVAEDLNEGKEFDSLELSLLYSRVPEEIKASMIDPFISIDHNEARIILRILDSREDLRRKEFLEQVKRDFTDKLNFEEKDVTVTGLLVLYNNMLQSLFKSQISTLSVVMVGIAAMFLVLFRSVVLSVIGIVPNVLGAVVVLGIMGWMEIPLDMMTITIAAITIGIAVDNGIHYIYRFREEFAKNGDYIETLYLCHSNIGKAVLYTTMTIIFGFSILILSNFTPTMYFGVFTALAMFIALLAALTLLPKLILLWRPFG
ncbi:MAG: MMPL family transporter [Bacteroidota bacterium]